MTAGNLAVTQEVITRLQQGVKTDDSSRNLLLVPTLFDATAMVGTLLRTANPPRPTFNWAKRNTASRSWNGC